MKTGNLNVRSNLWGNLEWQPLIKDKDLSSPPSPVKGNRYIVATTGSGDWTGHTGDIAYYNGSSWEFTTKKEGLICYVEDEDLLYHYNGSSWTAIAGISADSVDNFTILLEDGKIKVANRIELNIFLLAYRLAVANSITKFNLTDGMSDEFEEVYNSTDDYYYNEVDPGGYDEYTKLMLHCNGTDASTTFTDEIGHSVTANGNAQIDTAQKKFGTGSGQLDGSGDYLTIPDSADWDFGTGDFTVELWIRFGTTSGYQIMIDVGGRSQTGVGVGFGYNNSTGKLEPRINSTVVADGNWSPSTDIWYHIALVRSGTTVKSYINGTQLGTSSNSADITGGTLGVHIGCGGDEGDQVNGWIDEVRVSKGIARWTTNFTPSTEEYAAGSGTINDMILKSNAYTAQSAPTQARLVLFEEDVDSITINTDLKGYVSRDGGTTYSQVTLIDEGYYESGKKILSCAPLDISGQPSGTSMKWKVETVNTKRIKLHGVGMSWL